MSRLAALLLLTAQGIPFIHAGQPFRRSKHGDHNSYNRPDSVNMVRWQQKVENYDLYLYYRGLIALRRAHPLFRLGTAGEVRAGMQFLDEQTGYPVPHGCLAWIVSDVTGDDVWERALVAVNATQEPVRFAIPRGRWGLYAHGTRSGLTPLPASACLHQQEGRFEVRIDSHSGLILGEVRTVLSGDAGQ